MRAAPAVEAALADAAAERMLSAQAVALNAMFAEMARRAALNMGEHLGATESYMRLALKAQGQSRATVETLAAIKNPPVVFARQLNVNGSGNQQVNNVPAANAPPAPAAEMPLQESKLLETPTAAQTTGLFSKPHRSKSVRAQPARSGHGKS